MLLEFIDPFAFGICSPYWLILIMPFQIILAMRNSELIPITIPLDIAIGVAYIYVYTFDVPWIIGSCETFDNLLISLIPGYTERYMVILRIIFQFMV